MRTSLKLLYISIVTLLLVVYVRLDTRGSSIGGGGGGGVGSVGVNVLAYGAVGDGITDDTLAFQNAINSGGRVWVPGGHIYLLNSLLVVSGLVLECESWTAILKQRANSTPLGYGILKRPANDSLVENVIVRGCQFDGNKANNLYGSAIDFKGRNVLIENNYLHDSAFGGVSMGYPGSDQYNVTIRKNWCHNTGRSGLFWGCFSFVSGDYLTMEGNLATTSDNFSQYGYDIEPNIGQTVDHVSIVNNVSLGGNLVAKMSEGVALMATRSVVIKDNYIDATGSPGGPVGLKVYYAGRSSLITGNTVISATLNAPAVELVLTEGAIVSNNHITFPGYLPGTYPLQAGLSISSSNNAFISGNSFVVSQNLTPGYCIVELGTTTNTKYGLNKFRDCIGIGPSALRSEYPVEFMEKRPLAGPTLKVTDLLGFGAIQNLMLNSAAVSGWFHAAGLTATVDTGVLDQTGVSSSVTRFTTDTTDNAYASTSITFTTASNDIFTFSVWMRAITGTALVKLRMKGNIGSADYSVKYVSITEAWQRFFISGPATAVDTSISLFVNEGGADNLDFYIRDAQLERGTVPGPCLRTTSAAVTLAAAIVVNCVAMTIP